MLLAGRFGVSFDTGSSVAALSKELRAVTAKALEGAQLGADPVDQLRTRRLGKLGLMCSGVSPLKFACDSPKEGVVPRLGDG